MLFNSVPEPMDSISKSMLGMEKNSSEQNSTDWQEEEEEEEDTNLRDCRMPSAQAAVLQSPLG